MKNELDIFLRKITSEIKKLEDAMPKEFNVFSALKIESDEVCLHSRFIAELLNPYGSHNLKGFFLEKFIKKFVPSDFKFNIDNVTVEVEKYIGEKKETTGGRLDIIISDDSNNIIMIENKIFAPIKSNQLLRYSNYKTNSNKFLFYLTLDGKAPLVEQSEKVQCKILPISYKEDIIKWLESCFSYDICTTNKKLCEIINQYIDTLKNLTENKMDEIKKITTEVVLQSKENLYAAFAIYKSFESIKSKIQELFWTDFSEEVKNCFIDVYYDNKNYKIEIPIKKYDNNDQLVFTFEQDNNFYFSFKHKGKKENINKNDVDKLPKLMRYKTDASLAWDYPNKNLFSGSKLLNLSLSKDINSNELIYEILDTNFRKKLISEIINESKEIIEIFCKDAGIQTNSILK